MTPVALAVLGIIALAVAFAWRGRPAASPARLTVSTLVVPFTGPNVPAVGRSVHETFRVPLPTSVPLPHLLIPLEDETGERLTLIAPRAVLEALAREAPPASALEFTRLERLGTQRADELRRAHWVGRAAAELLQGHQGPRESRSLVQLLLCAGRVMAHRESGPPARELVVTYRGSRPGPTMGLGQIDYGLAWSAPPSRETLLFTESWFVS